MPDIAAGATEVRQSENQPQVARYTRDWIDYLQGCESWLRLPFAKSLPAVPTAGIGQARIGFERESAAAIARRARELGLTTFELLFGVFSLQLFRYTGRQDFLLGTSIATPVGGQAGAVAETAANLVAVRILAPRHRPVRQWLSACRGRLQWALDRAEIPFSAVIEAVKPVRRPGVPPLVQIQFSALDAVSQRPPVRSAGDFERGAGTDSARVDLSVFAIARGDAGIDMLFDYSLDLFDHSTIEHVARDYRVLMAAVMADCDQKASELPQLMQPEHRVPGAAHSDEPDFLLPASIELSHDATRGDNATHRRPFEPFLTPIPDVDQAEHRPADTWDHTLGTDIGQIDEEFFEIGEYARGR